MAKTKKTAAAAEIPAEPARFSTRQLMFSQRFASRRDIVCAALRHDRKYSIEEAEELINNYLKGKVK